MAFNCHLIFWSFKCLNREGVLLGSLRPRDMWLFLEGAVLGWVPGNLLRGAVHSAPFLLRPDKGAGLAWKRIVWGGGVRLSRLPGGQHQTPFPIDLPSNVEIVSTQRCAGETLSRRASQELPSPSSLHVPAIPDVSLARFLWVTFQVGGGENDDDEPVNQPIKKERRATHPKTCGFVSSEQHKDPH